MKKSLIRFFVRTFVVLSILPLVTACAGTTNTLGAASPPATTAPVYPTATYQSDLPTNLPLFARSTGSTATPTLEYVEMTFVEEVQCNTNLNFELLDPGSSIEIEGVTITMVGEPIALQLYAPTYEGEPLPPKQVLGVGHVAEISVPGVSYTLVFWDRAMQLLMDRQPILFGKWQDFDPRGRVYGFLTGNTLYVIKRGWYGNVHVAAVPIFGKELLPEEVRWQNVYGCWSAEGKPPTETP